MPVKLQAHKSFQLYVSGGRHSTLVIDRGYCISGPTARSSTYSLTKRSGSLVKIRVAVSNNLFACAILKLAANLKI